MAIYYAAVAGALVFHDSKITEHSFERLERAFGMLIAKTWMASELVGLFEKCRTLAEIGSLDRRLAPTCAPAESDGAASTHMRLTAGF